MLRTGRGSLTGGRGNTPFLVLPVMIHTNLVRLAALGTFFGKPYNKYDLSVTLPATPPCHLHFILDWKAQRRDIGRPSVPRAPHETGSPLDMKISMSDMSGSSSD